MSRMIMLLGVAVVLFSLAAGGSWYLQNLQRKDDEDQKGKDEPIGKNTKTAPYVKPLTVEGGGTTAPIVRPPISSEAEKNAALGLRLNVQDEVLKRREENLAKTEKRINIVHEKIREEHVRIEESRKMVKEELAFVEKQLERLEKRAAEVDAEKQRVASQLEEIKKIMVQIQPDQSKGLMAMAKIYESMEVDVAAGMLVGMVERGKVDDAVTIFRLMKTDKSASIFGKMNQLNEGASTMVADRLPNVVMPSNKK